MTSHEFERALLDPELERPIIQAARRVLVDGLTYRQAASESGFDVGYLHRECKKIRTQAGVKKITPETKKPVDLPSQRN